MFRALVLVLALFLVGAAAASPAAEVSVEDAVAIRAVITSQLDALARDDAARAFSFATEGIRERFGTADAFIDMVRTSYTVVYRPKSVHFEKPVIISGEVIQPVRMTDGEGQLWVALYPMERQANGVWRINGCQLQRLKGRAV